MITAKKRREAEKAGGDSRACGIEALALGYALARECAVKVPPHRHIAVAADAAGRGRMEGLGAICCSFFISLELRRTDRSCGAKRVSDAFFEIFSRGILEIGIPWIADDFIGFMTRTPKGDFAAFTRRLAIKMTACGAKALDFGGERHGEASSLTCE